VASSAPTFRTPVPDVPPLPLPSPGPLGAQERAFRMEYGTRLHARVFAGERPLTILYVHGMMSSSSAEAQALRTLAQGLRARVVGLDLPGHGASGSIPGDVPAKGQYERDVAEVVRTLRAEEPGRRLVLAGMSMGGGVVVRHALLPDAAPVDGYLLFAPHLGMASSTTPRGPPRRASPRARRRR
jgi:alpha-beta hydrolase superfamily lysophospholipase